MTLKRRSAGAWTSIATTIKRKAAGSWVNVGTIKRRLSGAWVDVWPAVRITNQSISDIGPPTALARYRLKTSGIVEEETHTASTTLETWLLVGSASDYEARATVNSGALAGVGNSATGSWLGLGSSRQWGVGVNDTLGAATLTIEIRNASSGDVLASAFVTLDADDI